VDKEAPALALALRGNALSPEAGPSTELSVLSEQLLPVRAPPELPAPPPPVQSTSSTAGAFRRIVSSISCLVWLGLKIFA